jgi:hypothetical protein
MKEYIFSLFLLFTLAYGALASDYTVFTRQSIDQTNAKWYLEISIVRTNKAKTDRFVTCQISFKFDSTSGSGLNFFYGLTDESNGWSDITNQPDGYLRDSIRSGNLPILLSLLEAFYLPSTGPTNWNDCVPWPKNDTLRLWRISFPIALPWMKSGISLCPIQNSFRRYFVVISQTGQNELANCTYIPPDSTFPLPVQLLAFAGRLSNRQVSLSWKTATETNSFGYDIERSALNTNWEHIGFVPSHGTSTAEQDYTFVDLKLPAASDLYYRLKMTDLDGSFTYSQVLKIPISALPGSPELRAVYPNPSRQDAVVHFSLPREAIVSIALYDILGNEVRRLYGNEALGAGDYLRAMDVAGLANGKYFVRMSAGDYHKTVSFVLQR